MNSAESPTTGPSVSRSSGDTRAVGTTPPAIPFRTPASTRASQNGSVDPCIRAFQTVRAEPAMMSATCSCGNCCESTKRTSCTGSENFIVRRSCPVTPGGFVGSRIAELSLPFQHRRSVMVQNKFGIRQLLPPMLNGLKETEIGRVEHMCRQVTQVVVSQPKLS